MNHIKYTHITGRLSMIFAYIKMAVFIYEFVWIFKQGTFEQ